MSPRMVIYLISRIRDEFHKHLNQELKEKFKSVNDFSRGYSVCARKKEQGTDAGYCKDDQSGQIHVNRSCR